MLPHASLAYKSWSRALVTRFVGAAPAARFMSSPLSGAERLKEWKHNAVTR